MKYKFFNLCFAVLATAMTLVSCEAEFTQEMSINLTTGGNIESASPDFTANISDNFSNKPATRSAISSTANEDGTYSLSWEAGDEISISEGNNTAVYTTASAGTTGKFTKKSGYVSNTASKYVAFYPSSLTTKNQKLPAIQEYVAGNVKNYPMYAESSDYNLSFKNLCGIIRLSLKNTDTERRVAVKSISVSVEGNGLSGNFTIDENKAAVVSGTDGVILNCGTAVALGTEANDFNIVVPKGSYEAMKIKITAEDGKVVNLEGQSAVTINRSGITKVNVSLKAADFTNGLETITFTDSDVEFTER